MTAKKVIGDVVQYRLDTPIASGAFSTVWQCTELSSGRTYAVKIVDRRVAQRNKMTEAFIREVKALELAGSSPYVTRLVDKMVSKHNYYLIMDLAEGGTLLDLIREQRQELRQLQTSLFSGRTPVETLQTLTAPFMLYDQVQRYFKQLLLALATLHDRNIVHRDVKPENILLNKRRTRLVLSDFGFACHCMPGVQLHRACGTLKYCAPELLCDHPAYDGRKVDVWAAGITLYMMLFGGFPYRCSQGDPDALLEAIETTKYPIPRPIPCCIEDILGHMLCVDAAQRWSVKQLLQHPWISGLESRCNSVAGSVHEAATSLTVSFSESSGAVTGMLSESCPPVDALPSDEDHIDDGFYEGSEHGQFSSNVSGERSRSATSTTRLRQHSANADFGFSHREDISLSILSPTSLLRGSDSAVDNDGTLETLKSLSGAVLHTSPDQRLCMSPKEEILQHGSAFVRLTTIESAAVSDDDCAAAEEQDEEEQEDEEEEESGSENDAHHWEEVREGTETQDRVRNTAVPCSLFTGLFHLGYLQPSGRWARYLYGLWLTASMVFHLAAFILVCGVAVILRTFLKYDIVDLPLPEAVRSYISYLLTTPLLRAHAHLSAATPSRLASAGRTSSLSPVALLHRYRYNGSSPHRPPRVTPIPGSGLRRYVRVADALVRDSFVGSTVLSHNASLVSLNLSKPTQPCSGESLEGPSSSLTAAVLSVPRLASAESPASSRSAEKRGAEACAECKEQSSLSLTPSTEMWRTYASHLPLSGERAEGDLKKKLDCHEQSLSMGNEGSAQMLCSPLTSDAHTLAATPVLTSIHTPPNEKVKLRGEGQNVDSQEGATDDTGSTDSVLDKSAQSSQKNILFSPVATMGTTPDDFGRSLEDFPVVEKVGHN